MRRQQYYRSTAKPSPETREIRTEGSRGNGGVVFLLVLFMAGGLLSWTGYWPSWSALTGRQGDLASAVNIWPRGEPPTTAPAAIPGPATETVSIPPLATPLVASSLTGLPAIVTPASAGRVMPVQVREPRMPSAPIPGVLRLPAGQGPVPAVILLHGCGGPFTGMPDWAYRLNAWGYAVLMPDSMTPRGLKSVCAPNEQARLTPWDRVGDVGAAASWLRTRPEIDPDRIAVLGLSHGGMTAALSVQVPYASIRLRAAVDYYGSCYEPRLHGGVPLLVLAGEADDWGDPAARCKAYGKQLRPDQPFEIHTYPGVFHAFDSGPMTRTTVSGHVLAYNKAAAEDSFARVRTFLDREVRN